MSIRNFDLKKGTEDLYKNDSKKQTHTKRKTKEQIDNELKKAKEEE